MLCQQLITDVYVAEPLLRVKYLDACHESSAIQDRGDARLELLTVFPWSGRSSRYSASASGS